MHSHPQISDVSSELSIDVFGFVTLVNNHDVKLQLGQVQTLRGNHSIASYDNAALLSDLLYLTFSLFLFLRELLHKNIFSILELPSI